MFVEISFWFFCLQLIFAPGQMHGVGGELHLQYVGCFKGNGSSQVIDAPLQNNVTIEQCIQKCYNDSTPRKTFAGLSNGNICVCSDHFGLQISETECKKKCVGSDNQYCGGVYVGSNPVYSVYAVCEIGSFGKGCKRRCHCKDQLPCERRTGFCQSGCEDHWGGESCNKSKVDIKDEYIGCYKDNQTAAFDMKNPGRKAGDNYSTQNTIEFCIEICSSYNYTYAGLQYGYDCLCGEQYDRYGNSPGCDFKCPGNRSQTCGGNWANSVYHACPTGFYGRSCANRCNCANGARCSKTGCQNGRCEPGWKGATCNSRDCLDNNGNCGPYQQCTSIDLGYASVNECRCQDGYMKLGSKCIGIHDQYIGCFRGNVSSSQYIVSNEQLTIDICLTWCHQLNNTYTMLKAGTTCLCVDSLKETMPQRDENCNVPCSGNQHQYCGMKDNMDSGYVVYGVTGGSWCSSNAGCDANERCKDINLGFIKIKRCRCMKGFEQKDPWGNCTDVDECLDFENTCPNAINCTNTFGSFQCSYCSDGLIVDNGTCIFPTSTNYGSQHATAFIIGGVLGFVAITIFIILIVFLTLRRKQTNQQQNTESSGAGVADPDNTKIYETLDLNMTEYEAIYTQMNASTRLPVLPDNSKQFLPDLTNENAER